MKRLKSGTRIRGIGIVLALVGATSQCLAQLPGPTLENGDVGLAFGLGNGGLIGLSLSGEDDASPIEPRASSALWRIHPLNGGSIEPDQAGSFEWERRDGERPGLSLRWSRFGLEAAPDLRVTATVTLGKTGIESRWNIRLENLGGLMLRGVSYPRIAGLRESPGESLAAPVWMGHWTGRARELLNPEGAAPRRWEWESPGLLSMQCLAWCGGEGPGMLIAAHDDRHLRKQFAVYGEGEGGVGLEVFHQPPEGDRDRTGYEPPYDVALTPFFGSWDVAARLYAEWARGQPWAKESRLKTGRTPEWARNAGLWVWNRGRSEGVLEPAALLQRESGLPVSVFWHWWHGCAYDAGFPEYLPPREGAESFRRAVDQARLLGVHCLVYMNQRLWGMTAASWAEEGAERYAVKGPDGTVRPEVYNTFMKVPCASMCMGTSFWRNKYAEIAEGAIELGAAGIYMDQACSSLACYDPTHGHPLGGGAYWMEGFRLLEGDIRKRTASIRPVTLSGEGCGEAWLPHLDLMLSLQVSMERYAAPGEWEPIPFFQAVYHDHALLYGNYSSLTLPPYDDLWPEEFAPKEPLALLDRKFSAQFRLEQARAFVWGQQPTLANFIPRLLEERAEEMKFFLDLARLRSAALAYLRDGIMAPPVDYESPTAEIPISRLSIYAGQHDAVKEYSKEVPMVLTTAWRSPDGTTAVAAVNISESSQRVRFELRSATHDIPERGVVRRIALDESAAIGAYDGGTAEVDFELPAASACLIEILPQGEG